MPNFKNMFSSAELSNLWKVFMIENLLIPFKIPMQQTCKDDEIKSVISFALKISEKYVQRISEIYQRMNHPIPKGFSIKEDVNPDAPPLFTDNFYLLYIYEMSKLGFKTLPQAIAGTALPEILNLWNEALHDYQELHKRCLQLLIKKELFPHSPSIPIPKEVDFIERHSYLEGWFKKQRPLNAEEIFRVHQTAHKNSVSKTLLLGLSKEVKDPEVKKYLDRGIKNANDIVVDMHEILINEGLNPPDTYIDEVLDSSIPPYSEKLIMVHTAQMSSGAIDVYGSDLSSVFRKDIVMRYMKMVGEALLYGEDGMNLLIKKGWIEEPPKNNR